jgi:hypothetical protein
MTADMAEGYKKKLDEIAETAGGQEATNAIKTAVSSLLSGRINQDGTI